MDLSNLKFSPSRHSRPDDEIKLLLKNSSFNRLFNYSMLRPVCLLLTLLSLTLAQKKHVHKKPRFTVTIKNITLTAGENGSYECAAIGELHRDTVIITNFTINGSDTLAST